MRELGIPILTDDIPREIDLPLDLIKGGGSAMLREKVVPQASRREVIIVDASKLSPRLGTHWPLLVAVLEFGWRSQARLPEKLGAAVTPRKGDGGPYRTDHANILLDSQFSPIAISLSLSASWGRELKSWSTGYSSPSPRT